MPIPRLDTDSVLLTPVATVELDKEISIAWCRKGMTLGQDGKTGTTSLCRKVRCGIMSNHTDEHGGNIVDEINRIVSRK